MEQLKKHPGTTLAKPLVESTLWGQAEGKDILLYTLTNRRGSEIKIINIGAAIVSLKVPDRQGRHADIVLGYATPREYLCDEFYMGSVVGRYANRIAGGIVRIGGSEYRLSTRAGGYHLHGGNKGFNKHIFEGQFPAPEEAAVLRLHLLSPHLDEGFPGELSFAVTYTFRDDDILEVAYDAVSDRSTIVNFTQHAYFNLSGNAASSIVEHRLQMHSGHYLPVNHMQVPTGEIASVEGTPFDFATLRRIGERIDDNHPQLLLSGGYDHSYILETGHAPDARHAATVWEEKSGRVLDVYTTEPAIHFYSGNFLAADTPGKGGLPFGTRSGLCLETQHYPDAPNHPHFPSTVLEAGKKYSSKTLFAFSVK